PTFENISIKAFFESQPGLPMFGEHMFLTEVSTDGKTITGRLNSDSWRREDLKEGQEVLRPRTSSAPSNGTRQSESVSGKGFEIGNGNAAVFRMTRRWMRSGWRLA